MMIMVIMAMKTVMMMMMMMMMTMMTTTMMMVMMMIMVMMMMMMVNPLHTCNFFFMSFSKLLRCAAAKAANTWAGPRIGRRNRNSLWDAAQRVILRV